MRKFIRKKSRKSVLKRSKNAKFIAKKSRKMSIAIKRCKNAELIRKKSIGDVQKMRSSLQKCQ